MKGKQYKLILTSRGVNSTFGKNLVKEVFKKENIDCNGKSIFLITYPEYEIDDLIEEACHELGFSIVYKSYAYENTQVDAMPEADMLFVTEGNTFDIIKYFRENKFDKYVKKIMDREGAVYIGSSAGAVLASNDIRIAELFDKNFGVNAYSGFGLLPATIDAVVPHYTYNECKKLRDTFSEDEIRKYGNVIYNVANSEALVLDIQNTDEEKRLLRKKRIRIEEEQSMHS